MMQHPGKSTLRENGLILALGFHGNSVHHGGEDSAAGRESMAAGSWLVTLYRSSDPQMRKMSRSWVEPDTVTLKPLGNSSHSNHNKRFRKSLLLSSHSVVLDRAVLELTVDRAGLKLPLLSSDGIRGVHHHTGLL